MIVTTPQSQTVLDQPYSAVDVWGKGDVERKTWQPDQVKQQFAAALRAQPPHPISFIVYFLLDKDELTPESKPQLDQIKAELARRPAPEIRVIGYTDSVGSEAHNEALSLKRAEAIHRALIKAGIGGKIEVIGRGEQDPLVPTAEGVPQPRNRRAEINVR
jgi:outer membrane protein OmpA-like peptidoglycan-associated protein